MNSPSVAQVAVSSERSPVSVATKIAIHVSIFLVAFLILMSRRPDAILHAQFWAEDGKYWYADAYQFSWRCLFMPLGGYLNTVSRLIGLFALLFPFACAPLVMNICAFVFQILPLNFFLSSRWASIPLVTRLLASLVYLAAPNSYEIHGNTTNIQWHLALLGCLILLARPAPNRFWLFFDLAALALVSLDGPLGIPLILVAAVLWWQTKEQRHVTELLALVPGTLLEIAVILISRSRDISPLGVTLSRLTGILGGQVFFSSILGMQYALKFYVLGDRHLLFILQAVFMLAGLGIFAYAVRYAPRELRLFMFFATVVLVLALWQPRVDPNSANPQWELLQFPGLGNRYYFYPMLAFLACLLWMVGIGTPTTRLARCLALPLLLLLPVGICQDWRHPAYKEKHFQDYAAAFESAVPGTKFTIPINPTGWQMDLVKK